MLVGIGIAIVIVAPIALYVGGLWLSAQAYLD